MLMSSFDLLGTILAWQNNDAAGAAGAVVGMIINLLSLVVGLGIQAFIAYTHSQILEKIPPQFRQMEPWQPWLLFVPCFNIVWMFFVYMKTPASLQAFAASKGRGDLGDCGAQLGLWAAITVICCGPIGLVLLVMYMLKIMDVSKQLSGV